MDTTTRLTDRPDYGGARSEATMGLFDDPREFYTDDRHGYLRQGDLILAPSATLWSELEHPVNPAVLATPRRVGTVQSTLLWPALPGAEIAGVAAEVLWGLAMVLPHECAINRDFNRRLVELQNDGVEESNAIQQASNDPKLDPTIVVTPVLPFTDLPEADRRAIASGGRIGVFPVCAGPDPDKPLVPTGAVDLGRVTEISRQVIHQLVVRLSDRARAVLRFKLAEQWAYRNQSLEQEIARAVNRTIVRTQVLERSKDLQVILDLDDGSTLILKQDQRRPGRRDLPPRESLPDRRPSTNPNP